jgi:two-component system, NtrC family, sensor kinase
MKCSLLILVGITLWLPVYTQNVTVRDADKLKSELSDATADSSRALIMTQLAEAYRDWIDDSTFYYGQKALELSRKINYLSGEAKALLALSYYFFNRGDLAQGLELGLNALAIARQHNLRYDEAFALIRIGNVYMGLGDYREGLKYFLQTRKITANTEMKFFYAVTFWRSADAYLSMKMTDSAFYNAKMAEDLALEIGEKFILNGNAPYLGAIYAEMGNDQLALQYLHKSKNAYGAWVLASFYKDRGQFDSAKYYAQRLYDYAVMNKVKQSELNAALLLSSLYEVNDPRTALHYQKVATAARDSLIGAQKIMAATAVAFREKEKENELLLAQMEYRSKMKIYASLAGLGVVIFVALLLFRNNRNQRKANALLQDQKNEITRAMSHLKTTQAQLIQSEKMASLGELTAGIAHEIQNPLNFVNNFSEVSNELLAEMKEEIEKGNVEDAKAIALDVKQNLEKILHHGKRADGIVKGMLQHSRSSSGTKELTNLNALADEYLRLAYHGLRAKDKSFNAKFETHFDESLEKVEVVPQDIGRVILNLITNAFYAVTEKKKQIPEGYEPTVIVSSRKVDGKVEVSVKDNGSGIPKKVLDKIFQPFFTTKPTGQGTGLGLSLSYDIVKAHGGELKVETKEGEGSEFIISLPLV